MEEKFKDVLEKNETITKVFRPNGCKYWTGFILTAKFCWIWVFLALFAAIPEEGKKFDAGLFWWLFIGATAAFLVGMLLTILFGAIYYKNRYYAYTNKRIIIRTGVIGIDYKSLEFRTLTATTVQVTFLDKILGRNTGSLRFGSPSAPMGSVYAANPYTFKHIVKPYDTLRELKEVIDSCEETSAAKVKK